MRLHGPAIPIVPAPFGAHTGAMRWLFALMLLPVPALAGEVALVPYDDVRPRLSRTENFEEFPKILSPGTRLEGVQIFPGIAAAERFAGQVTVQDRGYDALTGYPAAPLELAAGPENQNLAVSFYFILSNHLLGSAAPGYPAERAGGEGAIALMFDIDQSALGFRVATEPLGGKVHPGTMSVAFYARDGRLIDRLEVALDWGRPSYGFERTDGAADIAGITIENRDPAGIAIDDIIFDPPKPSS